LSLAISDTKGHGYKVLLEDIDHIVTQSVVGKSEVLIIYQKSGVGFSLKLDLSDLKVISNIELPKVGNTIDSPK
jgi:hypothetical protein